MLRNNSVQLEMFKTDDEASGGQGASGGNPLHLKKIRDYQKAIYTLVAFIFVSLVSFSFGVEKGKKQIAGIMPGMKIEPLSLPKVESANNSLPVETKPVFRPQEPPLLAKNKKEEKTGPLVKTLPLRMGRFIPLDKKSDDKFNQTSYTIQVASIAKSQNVTKELSKLKNKGYTAFSLAKGKYTVICVGRFNTREDAQINLARMKNSYPDCQIRRL